MNLTQYRRQAAAQNRHRLWLCLSIAAVLHAGAILLTHRPTPGSAAALIQFIAIDTPTASSTSATLRAPVDSAPQPTREVTRAVSPSPQGSLSVLSESQAPQLRSSPKPAIAKDKIWGDYLANLRRKIYQQWSPIDAERPIKVRFAIDRQGKLMDLELIHAGSSGANQAAIAAVQAAAPFDHLPIAAKENQLRVTFTFDGF
jgi:outer membrane biosynthesis protein TonB